jgi:hypothetical protein
MIDDKIYKLYLPVGTKVLLFGMLFVLIGTAVTMFMLPFITTG